MIIQSLSSVTGSQWMLIFLSAALIGMAKGGVKGAGMLAVPLMAGIYGGKASTGIVLPMLVMADAMAVKFYNRDANWRFIWRLIPAAAAGILLAMVVGIYINDELFKRMMGMVIIASLALMIIQERRPLSAALTGGWVFGSVFGLLGGFSTMIGNAAGPVMTVYLLAIALPKNQFLGTGAWFFLLINLFKVPLHIFVWKTITWSSLPIDLVTFPAILIGAWAGMRIVRLLPEREFRYFMIGMTFIVALRLFF